MSEGAIKHASNHASRPIVCTNWIIKAKKQALKLEQGMSEIK